PANESGTITKVYIWARNDCTSVDIGIFYNISGNNFSTRSHTTIGPVTAGSEQEFDVNLAIEAGDYIGFYEIDGELERDNSGGSGYWYKVANQIPADNYPFTDATSTGRIIHLYGTGGGVGAYYHGLKVQGEGELALCDVGSHPLRMRKGGTTYGIELVETDDPNASRIRVKTGAGIKAIRKYT
ncbi:unnamed protein product, partial [marine sediment metagenome]